MKKNRSKRKINPSNPHPSLRIAHPLSNPINHRVSALFKNHHPFTVLVLLIFALLVNLPLMLHPAMPVAAPDQAAYGWLVHGFRFVVGDHPTAFSQLSVLMLFAQALYLNHVSVQYRFFARATYLPAFVYLLLTALHPGMGGFSPELFANWAFIGALQAGCSLNGAASPRKQIFNLGFLLALTALLQGSNILLLGALIAAMVIMRSFKTGEWVVAMLGYLTPFYFFAGLLFLLDKLEGVTSWRFFALIGGIPKAQQLHVISVLTGLGIIVLIAFFVLQQAYNRMAISVRRNWSLALAFFLITIPAVLFALPSQHDAHWLLPTPPLALLIALPLYGESNRKLGILLFWFLIVFLTFAQLSLLY